MSKISKTPISILTELCAQKKVQRPVFKDLDPSTIPAKYADQNFKFWTHCNAFGKDAYAGGATKKASQHTAAQNLLLKLQHSLDSDDVDEDMPLNQGFSANDSITQLLDLCVQRNFHKPDFFEVESYGPTHAPTFTIECRLDSIRRRGSASSKQDAKQLAAREVLNVLKASYPDQEKKVAKINDENSIREECHRKILTYMELKNRNQTDKMGCLLSERNKFFVNYKDQIFISQLKKILKNDVGIDEKFSLLVTELKTEWPVVIDKFLDTDLLKFELLIEFDQFTVLHVAEPSELKKSVIDYFMQMLDLNQPREYDYIKNIIDPNDLTLIPFDSSL